MNILYSLRKRPPSQNVQKLDGLENRKKRKKKGKSRIVGDVSSLFFSVLEGKIRGILGVILVENLRKKIKIVVFSTNVEV